MALIAVAADKGAPGVTTTALALAAVWPRPVLLAECDPAGGDLVYRLPAADGGRLDQRRGLLSLAVAARRGLQPHQAWEHTQKLNGGLDILTGVTNAEQGAGLNLLWGPVGRVLAASPQADVIADCGRLGVDGPLYDLLAEAALVVLVTRASLGEVVRLRDRSAAVATAVHKRGRTVAAVEVVVIADHKHLRAAIAEIAQALEPASARAGVAGGLADDPRGAELLRGEWGGKLDKSLLIRTARGIAGHLAGRLPASPAAAAAVPAAGPGYGPAAAGPVNGPVAGPITGPEPLVSAATWAAAPGARYAAARGYPPMTAPSGGHQAAPDESHAVARPDAYAAAPAVPPAVPPVRPGAQPGPGREPRQAGEPGQPGAVTSDGP